MNYRITGGTLLLHEGEHIVLSDRTLYVRDGRLSFTPFADGDAFETIDASRRLVMPGLINMHTHAYMTVMRNYADDVDFNEWLFNRCMPVEDRLPQEAAYWTSLLAFSEMIRTGTTSFVDMHMFHRQSPLAAVQAGMRGFIGRGLVGEDLYTDGWSRFSQALEEKQEFESDTMQFILSPHAIYSCSDRLLQQVAEEADKHGMLKQTHLSESVSEVENCLAAKGKTPVQLLSDLGFLDDRTILAHCVQMRGNDLDIIAQKGASIVTNPASNAKLGNGFAPLAEIRQEGINLCIGTDGTASNNTLNMFREMGLVSLIHKGIAKDSTALPSEYVVNCATVHAAAALHQAGRLGTIAEDAAADLIFLDLDAPSMFPNNNPVSALCYSASGSEVTDVMIAGSFVMRRNELLTIDYERVRYEVQRVVDRYL